jgi:hypothetical protein
MFAKAGSKLDESNRTSVHIHLNAQRWHMNRLCAFAALFFSVEEALTEWCGDHRVGNLFCLRAKDAPGIVSQLKKYVESDGKTAIPDGLHYAGLNFNALIKFGSVEVRSLRGCTDKQTILDWVEIMERLYKLSGEFPDPRGICDGFSGEGPMAFFYRVLGPKAQLVKDGINWDHQRLMNSLYEGIRLAQDLCYCRDWSDFEPVNLAKDPFNRDALDVIAQAAETGMAQPFAAPLTYQTYSDQLYAELANSGLATYNLIHSTAVPSTAAPSPTPEVMAVSDIDWAEAWDGPEYFEDDEE